MRFRVGILGFAGSASVLMGACGLEQGGPTEAVPAEAGVDAPLDALQVDADAGAIDASSDADVDAPLTYPTPDQLGGLQVWFRGDKAVETSTVDAGDAGAEITTWKDSSSIGDPNRDAKAKTGSGPTFVASNSQYAGKATVHLEDTQYLQTGTFSVPLAQPATMLVVGNASVGGFKTRYFVDSLKYTGSFALYAAGSGNVGVAVNSLQGSAGIESQLVSDAVTSPSIVIGIFNGSTSAFYVSSNTPSKLVNVGGNSATGFTIGNWSGATLSGGDVYATKGDIAEIAAWNRVLTPAEIKLLNGYASLRYGITTK